MLGVLAEYTLSQVKSLSLRLFDSFSQQSVA